MSDLCEHDTMSLPYSSKSTALDHGLVMVDCAHLETWSVFLAKIVFSLRIETGAIIYVCMPTTRPTNPIFTSCAQLKICSLSITAVML